MDNDESINLECPIHVKAPSNVDMDPKARIRRSNLKRNRDEINYSNISTVDQDYVQNTVLPVRRNEIALFRRNRRSMVWGWQLFGFPARQSAR